MIYIADRGYTDIELNRHVDEGANLVEEYAKEEVELTEERIKYLVEERKLYKIVEEINEAEENKETEEEETPEENKEAVEETEEEENKKGKSNTKANKKNTTKNDEK